MPRKQQNHTDAYITYIISYGKLLLFHVTYARLQEDHTNYIVCACLACAFLIICNLIHATYRHCAAPMQAVDGSLGFSVSLIFYKSAPCNEAESVTAHKLR